MKYTPSTFQNSDIFFSIPLYQRLFEWDEEKITQLLNDLNNSSDDKPYYIGMLTSTADNALVDGQQRFTVMMLIGIVLKSYYAAWNDFLMLNSHDIRLKFTARPNDEEYIKYLINCNSIPSEGDITPPYENRRMKDGIKYISNFIESKFSNDADRVSFAKYIFEKLTFFISELPKSYNSAALNKYFERMNSTGKNLEGHEILKVKLLQHLSSDKVFYTKVWNRVSNMDSPLFHQRKNNSYTESITDFRQRIRDAVKVGTDAHLLTDSDYCMINDYMYCDDDVTDSKKSIAEIKKSSKKPERSRRTGNSTHAIMNFSEFLLLCLYYFLKKNNRSCGDISSFFNKAHLVATFQKYLIDGSNSNEILDFFECIMRYRVLLDAYFIRTLDVDGDFDYYLESPSDEDDNLKKLKMFEEMLYVSSSPSTYYKWFSLLVDVTDTDSIISSEQLYTEFKKHDDAEHPAVNLKPELMTYRNINLYWFWRLDFYIWLNRESIFDNGDPDNSVKLRKARSVADRYIFKRNRSKEHIAPQTPQQDDTLRLNDVTRDSFGNLVMISAQQNSALSNSIYQEKRARVETYLDGSRSGSIESLKMLHAFTFNDTWDAEKIRNHEDIMFNILKDSY